MSAPRTFGFPTLVAVALGAASALAQPPAPPVRRLASPATAVVAGSAAPSAGATSAGMAPSSQGMSASTLSVYTPPACVPGVPFADVTCSTGLDPWIEQFGLDGITAGCGGGNYCPGSTVTRGQMAVFIEKAMRGAGNWPPHTVLVYHHPAGEPSSDQNSGTELLNLVGAIPSSGSEAPANNNRWLVKLGPGTFDLGSTTLVLPAWVSVEGSGMEETVITSAADSTGTVQTSTGLTTFTRLTVYATGSVYGAYAIVANSGRLVLDRAEAFADSSATYGIGVYTTDCPVELYNESGAYGLGGYSYGILTNGSPYHTLTIHHSVVEGYSAPIWNLAGYEVDMAYSGVYDAPPVNVAPGVFKCIGNYDRNEAAVTCP